MPPLDHPALTLSLLDGAFALYQLPDTQPIPSDILSLLTGTCEQGSFVSVTRTADELSIVAQISTKWSSPVNPEWKCIKVKGPMDLGWTGILNQLTTPLRNAEIPVFALSTWNTDYILVPITKVKDAMMVLKKDGWSVE